MAKNTKQEAVELERLSRKEFLRQRKLAEQTRQIRLAVIGVAALLGLILLTAIIVEYVVRPRQGIARVGEETITLSEWQERVRFERAQILIGVESAVDTFFNGDIGQAQAVFGQQLSQQLSILQDPEVFGEQVLNQMIDEILVRQEAQKRGITVTSAEVDALIGERYSYFDGGLPTPLPTGTNTPVPTPSLTPIPTAVITDTEGITEVATLEPTIAPTVGPTSTPLPTSTPVSLDAFEEAYGEELEAYKDRGANEELFRYIAEQQLYQERLLESLAEEKDDEIRREELQASLFVLSFGTEAEAEDYQQRIAEADYLTVWNTVRSDLLANPPAAPVISEDGTTEIPEEPASTATATEYVWRNQEGLELTLGITVTAFILDNLPIGVTSNILMNTGADGTVTYYIVQLSGRELRPVAESVIEQQKAAFLTNWLQEVRIDGFEDLGGWRNRAPRQPAIDPRYLVAQPTFTPEPLPTTAPEEDSSENDTSQENSSNNSEGE
jgi:hypothetical protein